MFRLRGGACARRVVGAATDVFVGDRRRELGVVVFDRDAIEAVLQDGDHAPSGGCADHEGARARCLDAFGRVTLHVVDERETRPIALLRVGSISDDSLDDFARAGAEF